MNRSAIKISVVIPSKNRARQLPSCLESVINQTLKPDEIIVVDDHSTDDTKEVVESFSSYGVRYEINKRSPGAQGARNHGILVAKNDWIAFQDSDDWWLPVKLEKQALELARLNFNPSVVVHCNGFIVEEKNNDKRLFEIDDFSGNCYAKLLKKSGPMFQGLLVHKSALRTIGYLDEQCPSFQEWDTSIRLARKNMFIHIKEPLFEWRRHDKETISKDLERDFRGHLYILMKHKKQILAINGSKGWVVAITELFAKGLHFGLYDRANELLKYLPYPTKLVGRVLLANRWRPKGCSRLLIMASKVWSWRL